MQPNGILVKNSRVKSVRTVTLDYIRYLFLIQTVFFLMIMFYMWDAFKNKMLLLYIRA